MLFFFNSSVSRLNRSVAEFSFQIELRWEIQYTCWCHIFNFIALVFSQSLLVSYDVSSLFKNVPSEETLQLLADKAFIDNWFNETHHLNLNKLNLVNLLLLRAATKDQPFLLMVIYMNKQTELLWVTPWSFISHSFLCAALRILWSVKARCNIVQEICGWHTDYHARQNISSLFLEILNQCHFSIKFTLKTESNSIFLFWGTQLLNKHAHVETKVYVKPTNTGLLLHYKSHVNDRFKRGSLKTMLDHAFRLSSNWCYFSEECDQLKWLFSPLKYPDKLFNSTFSRFIAAKASDQLVTSRLSAVE